MGQLKEQFTKSELRKVFLGIFFAVTPVSLIIWYGKKFQWDDWIIIAAVGTMLSIAYFVIRLEGKE